MLLTSLLRVIWSRQEPRFRRGQVEKVTGSGCRVWAEGTSGEAARRRSRAKAKSKKAALEWETQILEPTRSYGNSIHPSEQRDQMYS